jgi:hypothetical protein
MPDLDRFYREAAGRAAILAVAPTSSEGGMRDLVESGDYTLPIVLDTGDIASAYNVRYVPSLFVIDANGDLVKRSVGGTTFDQLKQIVDDLLGG